MDRRGFFPGWDALVEDDPAPNDALSVDTVTLSVYDEGTGDYPLAVDEFMASSLTSRLEYAENMQAV